MKKTDSLRKKTNTGGKKTDKTEYTDSIEKKTYTGEENWLN